MKNLVSAFLELKLIWRLGHQMRLTKKNFVLISEGGGGRSQLIRLNLLNITGQTWRQFLIKNKIKLSNLPRTHFEKISISPLEQTFHHLASWCTPTPCH